MSESPLNDDASQTDSRQKSFLRQAAGIIAGEKGMTPSCRLKLQALADRIKLPQAMFEAALSQLQSDQLPVEPWTRYEQAFADFLDSEFDQLPGELISPRMEQAAIEIAKDKYQLEASRAERILETRCVERDVSRISQEEAFEYARQSILARVGDRVFLDAQQKEQLYLLGKTWAMDPLAVDQIAMVAIAENRKQALASQGSRVVPLVIVLLGLVLFGLITYLNWPSPESGTPAVVTPGDSTSDRASNEQDVFASSEAAARFPQPLSLRIQTLDESTPAATRRWLRTANDLTLTRVELEAHYRECLASVLLVAPATDAWPRTQTTSGGSQDRKPVNMLADIFYQEPSAALVEVMVDTVIDLLDPTISHVDAKLTLGNSYLAHRCIFEIGAQALQQDPQAADTIRAATRWQLLKSQLPDWYPIDDMQEGIQLGQCWDDDERSIQAIATRHWNLLATESFSITPDTAANCVNAFERLDSKSRSLKLLPDEELKSFRKVVLLSILQNAPQAAGRIPAICEEVIRDAPASELAGWVDRLIEQPEMPAWDQLSRALVRQAKLSPRSAQRRDVVDALMEFRSAIKSRQWQPLLSRAQEATKLTRRCLERSSARIDPQLLPDRTAQLMVALNLELALELAARSAGTLNRFTRSADANRSKQGFLDESEYSQQEGLLQGAYQEIDRLLEMSDPGLRDLVSLRIDREAAPTEAVQELEATASDLRRKRNAFARLNEPLQDSSIELKILSLRQLSRIAKRFPDLPYSESAQLARFFLGDMPLKQRLELQQMIGSFAHWPTLATALADHLDPDRRDIQSGDGPMPLRVEMDRVLTVARLLMHREFEIENPKRWQRELRLKILEAAQVDLGQKMARNPNNENSNWTRLEIFMERCYLQRLRLLNDLQSLESKSLDSTYLYLKRPQRLLEGQPTSAEAGQPRPERAVSNLNVLISLASEIANQIGGGMFSIESTERIAVNELDQLALLNQLIVAHLASGSGERTDEDPNLLLSTDLPSSTVAQRFFESEKLLLKIHHRQRQQAVDLLLQAPQRQAPQRQAR